MENKNNDGKSKVKDVIQQVLEEIFDSKIDTTYKRVDAHEEVVSFTIHNQLYEIVFDNFNEKSGIDKKTKIFGVKFFAVDEHGKRSTKLLGDSKNAFVVFGVVQKELVKFASRDNPDVIYFTADQDRYSLYSSLTNIFIKSNSNYSYSQRKIGTVTIFEISKGTLDTDKYHNEIVQTNFLRDGLIFL